MIREGGIKGNIILGAVLAVFGGIVTQIVMVCWADPRVVSSTDFRLDKLAIDCIESSLPFPPFPEDYHGLTQAFEVVLKADK